MRTGAVVIISAPVAGVYVALMTLRWALEILRLRYLFTSLLGIRATAKFLSSLPSRLHEVWQASDQHFASADTSYLTIFRDILCMRQHSVTTNPP